MVRHGVLGAADLQMRQPRRVCRGKHVRIARPCEHVELRNHLLWRAGNAMSAVRILLLFGLCLGCSSGGGSTDGGGTGGDASCVGVVACNGGVMCGGRCCNPGEACVQNACTCGGHAACVSGDQCAAPGPVTPNNCGSICCGVSGPCPR
jgi:hypothetical protein